MLPPHLPASPIRRVFAAFVLGQMHPLRDGPCTSPYAAAVMRRVVVELGRIEDLCAPNECNARSCKAAQILYHLPAQIIVTAGSHGLVLQCFSIDAGISFTTSMRAFVCCRVLWCCSCRRLQGGCAFVLTGTFWNR